MLSTAVSDPRLKPSNNNKLNSQEVEHQHHYVGGKRRIGRNIDATFCYSDATLAPKSAESYTVCSMLITQSKHSMLTSLSLGLARRLGSAAAYHDIIPNSPPQPLDRTDSLKTPRHVPYYGTEIDRKLWERLEIRSVGVSGLLRLPYKHILMPVTSAIR